MSDNANLRGSQNRRRTDVDRARQADEPGNEWPEVLRRFERRGRGGDLPSRPGTDRRGSAD